MNSAGKLRIEVVVSMPFEENSYILWRDGESDCLVVDPGFEPVPILELIERNQLQPVAIVNTHGHVDHIAGNEVMKRQYPSAPLVIGAGDAPMLADPAKNLSSLGGFDVVSPPADRTVAEGDVLDWLGIDWLVREIPGHSPGHVVFIGKVADDTYVLGGDVLFEGSVGRTDFPGGSAAQLYAGIRAKLYCLPDSAVVYPGHGSPTTIGQEKRYNSFVRAV